MVFIYTTMISIIKSLEYMTIAASYHKYDGTISYVNPIFCELFKTKNELLVDNKLSTNYIGVDMISNFNVFDFIDNNIGNIENLLIKIKDNNEIKLVKINSLNIKNGANSYILLYNDITNNMNQSYLYEELFRNIKMGMMLIKKSNDNDFYVKDINPFIESTEHVSKDAMLNTNIKDIKFLNDVIVDMINDVYNNGAKKEEINVVCESIDNDLCWRNIYIYKILTGDIILLYEDITDTIKKEKKLEEFDKQKNTFLSNMSHEIRTPINTIVGFADLLGKTQNKNKHKEYIEIIKNSADSLTQIVNDILDISRIESGELNVNIDSFNVNKIITELYKTLKSKVSSNVEVYMDLSLKNLVISSDQHRFRQIFNNLISNALKFTTSGSINIGYRKDNGYITFYVKDTGLGIKEENKTKIFKRFEQINKSSKIGYGLGLTISNELIRLLNGELWFNSKYGEGSTFYFKLPYSELSLDKTSKFNDNSDNSDNIDNIDNIDLRGKTILLVEDIEFNIKLLNSYLEFTYADVILAKDGNEAIVKYDQNKDIINLILMDIQIPNMTGIEVTQMIRMVDKKIPIIAQTAYVMKEEIDDILSNGFDGILKKPFKKDELMKMISKFI